MKSSLLILTLISNLLIFNLQSFPQSTSQITYDAGTTIDVQAGADICADTVIINGTFTGSGTICDFVVGIEPTTSVVPKEFKLYENYPNPFNPATKIRFDIPRNSTVKLKIYDILGKETAVLVNTDLSAGTYEYSFDASDYSGGVYFYSLEAGDFKSTKKMLLIK